MPRETACQDPLSRTTLEHLCRQAGADDVGFVALKRNILGGHWEEVLHALPWVRSFIVFVRSLNRPLVRAELRSLSSAEFVEVGREVETIIHRGVSDLEAAGVCAVGVYCFPLTSGRAIDLPPAISLRSLAEAAGLGVIGKNGLLLHPRFGADTYLGGIALNRTITAYGRPLTYAPCHDCNRCEDNCPTGALARNRHSNYDVCIQSRGYDANTHCDLCRAVCPAGDEVSAL